MKYAIVAIIGALALLIACAPAMKEKPSSETVVVQETSGAAVDTGDIDAVTMQVEEIDNDMGLDDLDDLDTQLADLDKLEIG